MRARGACGLRRPAQRGYALLVALMLAGVAASALAYALSTPRMIETARERRTTAALALARDALTGRAAADENRPASLPCPDADDDGSADGPFPTHCTAYLGRLPWRTLGLPDVRDGWGERLWYALSKSYRDHPTAGVLNSDTAGQLVVRDASGRIVDESAPAIVFAPGPVVGTQVRDGAQRLSASNYLEGENSDGDSDYVGGQREGAANDTLLVLGRDALFRAVVARVAKEARAGLERYRAANGYYPAANPYAAGAPAYLCDPATFRGRIPLAVKSIAPPAGCSSQSDWSVLVPELPAWFFGNQWHLLTHYAVAAICTRQDAAAQALCDTDAADLAGESEPVTVTGVTAHARVVVIVSGPAGAGQTHPCTSAGDCLEDAANADGDAAYVKPSRAPDSNDRMALACGASGSCPEMP